MRKKELDHGWMMRQNGTGEFLPAVVPGSVYTDLMANGKMEDPYYRDNEYQALEVISHDYEYRVDFTAEAEIREEDEVLLRFDGIDTLADIWLNEVYLGKTNNMHRTWEFSFLKKKIRSGRFFIPRRNSLPAPMKKIRLLGVWMP